MKNIFLIFVLFFSLSTLAQNLGGLSIFGEMISMDELFREQLKKRGAKEVKGNPFLFQDWTKSGIVVSDGKQYTYHAINFNTYFDEVVVMKDKASYFVIDKEQVDYFIIDNRKFSRLGNKFYEVLYEGSKSTLLQRFEAKITEGVFNPLDASTSPDRINIVDDYYVKKGDKISNFSPSKKSLSHIFDVSQGEIKSFLKKQKLSLKKEKDLIKIFEHYNQ